MRDFVETPAESAGRTARPATLESLFANARHAAYRPGQTIAADGDPIAEVYQVVAGSVRCCAFTADGRRRIFRFARAGEFVGLADVDRWRFTVEAVDAVILRVAKRGEVEAALDASPALRRTLRRHVVDVIATRERQLTVLAFEPAEKRLHWFLTEFAAKRKSGGYLTLPMTRQEIGDYLGLSLETVSRSFGALRRAGLIEMNGSEKFRFVDAPKAAA
ncbi:MAG: helix-turn-helix domain-containing protein [Pseudomonadota bacterium]